MNSISSFITFTLERKQNQSLAFLDVKVKRNKDNAISTIIYKKPTDTNRYLQFDSHHPKHHKFAVAKTLHNRINTHVTNSKDKPTLHKQIQHTLTLNGFPRKFAYLAVEEKPRRPTNSFKSFTCLPYIHGVGISRVCSHRRTAERCRSQVSASPGRNRRHWPRCKTGLHQLSTRLGLFRHVVAACSSIRNTRLFFFVKPCSSLSSSPKHVQREIRLNEATQKLGHIQ